MVLLDSGWAHLVGALCLFAAAGSVFVLAATGPEDTAA
jgi:hypothetical protein